MGQIVVNVGSFDLTSHNGNTAYSSQRYFTIPDNAGITKCVATFATHVNTGNFQGKSFALNSVQAHPNTPWPTSGIALNPALLSTGQNAFRAAVKSQAGLSARWSIGDIYLTIDYNDVGGGGTPPPNIGAVTINKTALVAGDTITVSASACDAVYSRSVYLMLADNTVISSFGFNFGTGAASWTIEVPESLCAAYAADSETLILKAYMEVYQTGTYVGSDAKNFTMLVPSSAVPSISTFTATLNSNGVDASITKYVQNYSKCDLLSGASGALGSGIALYEISGGGWYSASHNPTFGPFSQTGDITFIVKATDTRGRTATRTVTINVLPYTPVSGVNLLAYRSDGSMVANDEGAYATLRGRRVFSSLDGQNAGTIKGRVYEKDTTPGGWTTMSDDTLLLLGGSMSIEKGYTTEISINDKLTSVVYVFQIPTAIVGIHITPGATGGGFGMYGQAGRWEFSAPIYIDGGEVLTNYGLGAPGDYYDIVIAFCATSNDDPNALSASVGTLSAFRINGLFEPYVFSIAMQKMYNSINAVGSGTLVQGGGGGMGVHSRVRFIYNGKYYCGYRYSLSPQDLHWYFHGKTHGAYLGFTRPFMINMRNTNTGAIHNAEVWNSLTVI